jgi:hypothetical protein
VLSIHPIRIENRRNFELQRLELPEYVIKHQAVFGHEAPCTRYEFAHLIADEIRNLGKQSLYHAHHHLYRGQGRVDVCGAGEQLEDQ